MKKVLIVDDQPELRHVLKICLRAAGVDLYEAGNGQGALAAVKEHWPDIIILDVMLPDMNGIDVCQQIRSEPSGANSYIMMLSARTDTTMKVSGLEHGADAYLTKPFEPQEIMAQLRVGLRAVQDRSNFLTDPLTGILGRRAFDELLDRSIARSRRQSSPLSFAMIDIDHFKNLNDTSGHLTGDRVLREFAGMLADAARESDLYFRWGGEEFAWILHDTDLQGAITATERFRVAVAEHVFMGAEAITTSLGVAMLREGESAASLCHRADEALLQAKSSGRNRVVYDKVVDYAAISA